MEKQKPSLPQGTRDFAPEVMVKRNFILDTIKKTFQKFGFLPLETPAMEQLEVLTGKYGEEGDQLIFKILNNGNFLKVKGEKGKLKNQLDSILNNPTFELSSRELASSEDSETKKQDWLLQSEVKKLAFQISDKALRYDLTVPFARFVVMNRNNLAFPFKRYQIQPVWRGDSPQKGRYREFYQCDADVVGTDSLICEAEIILMINEVLANLGIQDFNLKINNRKILTGIAEVLGDAHKVGELCVAIDKLDKIGLEKVNQELIARGFSATAVDQLQPILALKGNAAEKIKFLSDLFINSEIGQKGVAEIQEVFELVQSFTQTMTVEADYHLDFDITLARGLSYYTGAIFEVKVNGVSIGSISGGGRYDNLTGTFGMPDVSGVGFSFGVDRIFDVLEELQIFPSNTTTTTQVMLSYFDEADQKYALPLLNQLRQAGINSEIYPSIAKIKKQMGYADAKKIPFVIVIGSEERQSGNLTFKDMQSGEQQKLTIAQIIQKFC
ncbi:MAG: histidine--tRNA ligase [Microscillaceae bacterium]|jgi:histidyl-tRNA synthetase|nr:histidine--tRNA ligase [Microscillaceae bacterium]